MIRSMTAYARRQRCVETSQLSWELRSVNHRYLEMSLRVPEELKPLEQRIRDVLRDRVTRGKVEASFRWQTLSVADRALQVDVELAQAVIATLAEIEQRLPTAGTVSAMEILRWPGVVIAHALDVDALRSAVLALLEDAVDELVQQRSQEGERLLALFEVRAVALAEWVGRVRSRRPAVLAAVRERMHARLAEIAAVPVEGRLEQEMVLLAQKLDVAEELDRIDAHIAALRAALHEDKPVGRRLDFLMQELNREANTLAAKSADSETTAATVEMRVLIEQMREQVQNIE